MGASEPKTAGSGQTADPAQGTQLALRGDLRLAELEVLCTELATREEQGSPLAAIDLSGLGTLEPATLAVLVASLRRFERERICSLDHVLPCVGAGSCLTPQGIELLRHDEAHTWQELDEGRLLGWQTFGSDEGVLRAAFGVGLQLRDHTGWPPRSAAALAGLTFELGENVRQHSASPSGAVALEVDRRQQRVKLAVADTGIGIRSSLARNPKFTEIDDDLTAIEQSMLAGESGEPGTGGGMGLYLTRVLVRGNGGRVLVRSGDASCHESDERQVARRLAPLRGTLIGIEARTDLPLQGDEIRTRIQGLGGPGGVNEE